MSAQHHFTSKTKPKVLKFDDVLKSVNADQLTHSNPNSRNAHNNAAGMATNDGTSNQNDDSEALLIYKGLNLYRHKNNSPTTQKTEKKSTIIYMGKSTDYDIWRDNNVTYVRHKESIDFEDALYNNENIRFKDKIIPSNDPNIASAPPTRCGSRTSNLNIKKIINRSEFIDFKQKKNTSYNYIYNDITKKLERQTDFEFSQSDDETSIRNIIATGDVKSLSSTRDEARNVVDYIRWTKVKI